MQNFSDLKSLKCIYFSYIHSILAFGVSLYGATSINNLNSILRAQKNAIRIILKLESHASVKDHFASLGILTIYGMYISETVLHVKQNYNNLTLLGDFIIIIPGTVVNWLYLLTTWNFTARNQHVQEQNILDLSQIILKQNKI